MNTWNILRPLVLNANGFTASGQILIADIVGE
jgi:hypothetical protein